MGLTSLCSSGRRSGSAGRRSGATALCAGTDHRQSSRRATVEAIDRIGAKLAAGRAGIAPDLEILGIGNHGLDIHRRGTTEVAMWQILPVISGRFAPIRTVQVARDV